MKWILFALRSPSELVEASPCFTLAILCLGKTDGEIAEASKLLSNATSSLLHPQYRSLKGRSGKHSFSMHVGSCRMRLCRLPSLSSKETGPSSSWAEVDILQCRSQCCNSPRQPLYGWAEIGTRCDKTHLVCLSQLWPLKMWKYREKKNATQTWGCKRRQYAHHKLVQVWCQLCVPHLSSNFKVSDVFAFSVCFLTAWQRMARSGPDFIWAERSLRASIDWGIGCPFPFFQRQLVCSVSSGHHAHWTLVLQWLQSRSLNSPSSLSNGRETRKSMPFCHLWFQVGDRYFSQLWTRCICFSVE